MRKKKTSANLKFIESFTGDFLKSIPVVFLLLSLGLSVMAETNDLTPGPSAVVVVNELGWAGTKEDPAHEWIELLNNTEREIDLTGWTIRFRGRKEKAYGRVKLGGKIAPKGFYLLERISDDAVRGVTADKIYDEEGKLPLSDKGEEIELLDDKGDLIDTANFEKKTSGWPAGNDNPPASMERVDPKKGDVQGNWRTNRGGYTNGTAGLQATPGEVNESHLLSKEKVGFKKKLRKGEVFSFTVKKPEGENTELKALLFKPSQRKVAGVAGSFEKKALREGEIKGKGVYYVTFDTSNVEPGEYDIFLTNGNRVYFSEKIEVTG